MVAAVSRAAKERVLLRVLQPLQLTDVSLRHGEEIVELRDFLAKAGCAVRTPEALGQIADRIVRDRGFHRDLTSCVWVVIDRCPRISYSDLLGVLAIAAAGSSFAAAADEDDAHHLLRFLMEARHSLDGLSGNTNQAFAGAAAGAAITPSVQPLTSARGDGREASVEPLQLAGRGLYSAEEAQDSDRRRWWLPWVIVAGCVLVAVVLDLWLRDRPVGYASDPVVSVAPAAAGNAASIPVTRDSVPPSAAPDEIEAGPVVHSPAPRRNPRVMALSPAARSSSRTPTAAPYIPSPAANVPPPVTSAATHSPVPAEASPAPAPITRPSASLTTPAPVNRAAASAIPALVAPPATARRGLADVSSIPHVTPEQDGDNSSTSPKVPTLHRRRPLAPSSELSEDGTNVASAGSAPNLYAAGTSPNGSAGGTVRATSLGSMAANVMYSPVPAYPAAAVASHVQGEVKLSADVDRDGKVASVRVISGPPLLRDAAMDAVQQWRYRPYSTAGGPKPMPAIAIMDFQLP